MSAAVGLVSLAAAGLAGVRWLRVAQREHYLPGSVSRFAGRWWFRLGVNIPLGAVALAAAAATAWLPLAGVVAAVAVAAGPVGLSLRGRRPGRLVWTRRLRVLAAVWAGLHLLAVVAGTRVGAGALVAVLAAVATPLLVDLALLVTEPVERRLAYRFANQAEVRLSAVKPVIVGITGSYGKTTTKAYVAHLVGGHRSVLASPGSFNNLAGLSRTVNEHLSAGTEVLVAEMGTYGPGEIAEMCRWFPPDIAVITAIGPVHLERFGTIERTVAAKAEILEPASIAVLNVDDPHLARLAGQAPHAGKRVVRCSASDPGADVSAVDEERGLVVRVEGREVAVLDRGQLAPGNVACAVAASLAAGVPVGALARALAGLPSPSNRLAVGTGGTGATVIDDTYNSNPAGAQRALAAVRQHARDGGRCVVVTPGMVELGPRQSQENAAWAVAAAKVATDLVVVGHTNRHALVAGAGAGRARVVLAGNLDEAVNWVRQHVGEGDVVLYENDLPDHYP